MFHDVSPAFISPARRPMRGSGLGAAVDILPAGAGVLLIEVFAGAHAAADTSVMASDRHRHAAARGCAAEF
ncbi:MAG: hypothetical protein H0T48_07870 [Gemmatimonadaceae bacterium]|nr:hypothetical protein [Gemmatimonadaceae bacterium]